MSFGIADLSLIPMRSEKSDRSEMISQILFGEMYQVLEMDEKWVYVRLIHDGNEGWIDRKMYVPVSDEYVVKYRSESPMLTTEVFNIVIKEGDYGNKLIVAGIDSLRDLIIEYALMYYNTPYLWGGRSPYGIDCSGLVQIVYRMAGIDLPRDAADQVNGGQDFSFVEEALPGDLAFFGDDTGAITHVGIIWEQNRIIHASGRVRVDKIDHQGIFNEDLKRYTHNLKVIKRIIND